MFVFTTNSANGHMRVIGSMDDPAEGDEEAHARRVKRFAERKALAIGTDQGSIKVWRLVGEARAAIGTKWEPK